MNKNEFKQVPKAREIYEGRKIGLYLHNIKRGRIKISVEDSNFLIKLGVNLSTENAQEKVKAKLDILIDFMEQHNRKPNTNDVYKGIPLYTFLRNIQTGNTSLREKDQERLDTVLEKINNL